MKPIPIILVLAFIISFFPDLCAQDQKTIEKDYEQKENNWRFIISPYAWLAGQATDVGGEKLRQSFNDLASLTNLGFQLNAQVMYKNWILTADGTYANLGYSSEEGILQIDMDIKQYMLDLRLGYLVYSKLNKESKNSVIRGWAMEVNAGAKYWGNDVTLDYTIQIGNLPPVQGNLKEPQAWWDAMLGIKARIFLSRWVLLGLYGSGGGFGIGNSSKFSYDFAYTNTFKVSNLISITAGYRTFHYNRVDGEDENELKTEVTCFGPLIGVSFIF